MRFSIRVGAGALALGMLALPALAKDPKLAAGVQPAAGTTAANEPLVREASKALAHVAIANIAISNQMMVEAQENVTDALAIARTLEASAARLEGNAIVKAGKISHKPKASPTDYWLPLANDKFIVRTLDETSTKGALEDLEIADARMVRYSLMLNTKQLRNELESASAALQAKNYGDAESALRRAAASTFSDEFVVDAPLETARDNLVLARELAHDRNYGTARLALDHASRDLERFSASRPPNKKTAEAATAIQDQIATLKTQIDSKDPSLLRQAEGKIEGWISRLEAAV